MIMWFLAGVYVGALLTWCLLMLSKAVREGEARSPLRPESSSRTHLRRIP